MLFFVANLQQMKFSAKGKVLRIEFYFIDI